MLKLLRSPLKDKGGNANKIAINKKQNYRHYLHHRHIRLKYASVSKSSSSAAAAAVVAPYAH